MLRGSLESKSSVCRRHMVPARAHLGGRNQGRSNPPPSYDTCEPSHNSLIQDNTLAFRLGYLLTFHGSSHLRTTQHFGFVIRLSSLSTSTGKCGLRRRNGRQELQATKYLSGTGSGGIGDIGDMDICLRIAFYIFQSHENALGISVSFHHMEESARTFLSFLHSVQRLHTFSCFFFHVSYSYSFPYTRVSNGLYKRKTATLPQPPKKIGGYYTARAGNNSGVLGST
jgi:hypothetical protein